MSMRTTKPKQIGEEKKNAVPQDVLPNHCTSTMHPEISA